MGYRNILPLLLDMCQLGTPDLFYSNHFKKSHLIEGGKCLYIGFLLLFHLIIGYPNHMKNTLYSIYSIMLLINWVETCKIQ